MADETHGRRPVVYWVICPECLTYTWLEESALVREEPLTCDYCGTAVDLRGGEELARSCNRLQAVIEDIERQIAAMPTAIDVHRFIAVQVDTIAGVFNDRLDEFQEKNDNQADEIKSKNGQGG